MRHDALPNGFTVRVRPDVRRPRYGNVLIGGSPLRALRLGAPAQAALQGWRPGFTFSVRDEPTAVLARHLVNANFADPVLAASATVSAEELTVVIPVRDRPGQLAKTLAALQGIRCIVVDDASLNPAAVNVVCRDLGAEVVHLPRNTGPAHARNVGLGRATSTFVAFVDSDVTVDARTLLRLCRHFSDPAVALAGPAVRGKPPVRPRWFERYDAASSSLDLGDRAASVRAGAAVGWLPSACLVGRSSVLSSSDIGGFDADLRVGEDVDLVWRLVALGWQVRYDPTERADHDTRATVRGWLGRKAVYGSGSAALGIRHGDHVAPARLSPAMAIAGACLLSRRPWAFPVVLCAFGWSVRSLRKSLPGVPGIGILSMNLSFRGLGWAVRQESSLLLREWWPATIAIALTSRSARRALVSAVIVDSAVAMFTTRRGAGVASRLLGRRLDDAAYGAGIWWGAIRLRTFTPLRPRGHRSERTR